MLSNQPDHTPQKAITQRYEAPAIIYEGVISSRAGSPVGPIAPSDDRDIDPIDLFSDQSGE